MYQNNATIVKEEKGKDKEIQLSPRRKEQIVAQSSDTFCSSILKLIDDKKVSSGKYFISDSGLLPKVVREDDKLFHALVVSKYVLLNAHDALGHKGTARSYRCLKQLHYWKGLYVDVDIHVKQCMKCRQQNLHPQHYAQLPLEVP